MNAGDLMALLAFSAIAALVLNRIVYGPPRLGV